MSSRRHRARRRRQRLSRQLAHTHRPAPIPVLVPVPTLSGAGRLHGVLRRKATPTPVSDMSSARAAQRRELARAATTSTPTPTVAPLAPTPPPLPSNLPSAETPWAVVRYRSSGAMREPVCYYGTRELALAAASILVDEPTTVVDAMVTVKKRRSIVDDILARGRVNGLHHDRDDLDDLDLDDDDDEPLKRQTGSSRYPSKHPWKNGGGSVDAGRVSTSWRVRLAGAGTLTAVAVNAT